MGAISLENRNFDPSISNIQCVRDTGSTSTCAVGLIQFMPSTAKALGTSVDDLKKMSNVEQMDYVYKYFKPYANRITKFMDLKLVNFYPYAVGRGNDYIFGSEIGDEQVKKIARQNSGMDMNKDGKISMIDFKNWVENSLKKNAPELLEAKDKNGKPIIDQEVSTTVKVEKFTKRNWIPLTISFVAIGFGTYLLFKHRSQIIKSLTA
jgi:hypothetical protein